VSVCASLYFCFATADKNVTAAINARATTEELLDVSFSMQFVSYQGMEVISSSQNLLFRFEIYGINFFLIRD
jgi:hypothetical protein